MEFGMSAQPTTINVHVEDRSPDDGSIYLALTMNGKTIEDARASADVVDDIRRVLGVERAQLVNDMFKALEGYLRGEQGEVYLSSPQKDPQYPLRYLSRYIYNAQDEAQVGLVWYDVTSSETGPEEVPAHVKNQLRTAVHRQMTEPGSKARAIVDMFTK